MQSPHKPRADPAAIPVVASRPPALRRLPLPAPLPPGGDLRTRAARAIAVAIGRGGGRMLRLARADRDVAQAAVPTPARAALGDDDLMSAPQEPAPGAAPAMVPLHGSPTDRASMLPRRPIRGMRSVRRLFRVF